MKSVIRQFALSGIALLCISASSASDSGDGVLINAMRDELARSMQSLKIEQMGNPYFLAYRVDEIKGFQVSASFGAVITRSETNSRTLSVELRIGDHDFDNTNFLGRSNTANFRSIIPLPLENDYSEIRRQLWLATDKAYKRAQDLLARKQAALNNQSREEVPDFNTAEPITTLGKTIVSNLTLDAAESLVRELSQQFKDMPEINDSRVEAGMNNRHSHYINSEGTTFNYSLPVVWVQTLARTQSSDGTVLQDFDVVYQRWGELPDLKVLKRRVSTMGKALSVHVVKRSLLTAIAVRYCLKDRPRQNFLYRSWRRDYWPSEFHLPKTPDESRNGSCEESICGQDRLKGAAAISQRSRRSNGPHGKRRQPARWLSGG